MEDVALVLPPLGLVTEFATVVTWLKAEGDAVVEGEPVVQVETDKALMDVEAPCTGTLRRIVCAAGATVEVGALMADVAPSSAPVPTPAVTVAMAPAAPIATIAPIAPIAPIATIATIATIAPTAPTAQGLAAPSGPEHASAADGSPARRRASPAARREARKLGLDPEKLAATGPGGRVQLRDVEAAAARVTQRGPSGALPPMRRAIAQAMTLSARTIPQFTVSRAADLGRLDELKRQLAPALERQGLRLSLNDLLIRATAHMLAMHPDSNGVFVAEHEGVESRVLPASGTRIGLVVAVPGGVLVPVVTNAERHSVGEVVRIRAERVDEARAGRLRPGDTGGAVLSLSNLGARGPDRFTAMINPGESYVLAVGRRRDVPVVVAGAVTVRPVCELTLTADHRLVDGAGATALLNTLVDCLEGHDPFLFVNDAF